MFGNPLFWIGYACLFLGEVATVLINEVVDLPSDRNNRFYSPFTGGSRVLVEGPAESARTADRDRRDTGGRRRARLRCCQCWA